jgi:hypothetical protein
MARMTCQVIPIHAVRAAPAAPLTPTRVCGEARRVHQVLDALVAAVQGQLVDIGPTARWLREVRLTGSEAFVLIAPDLGHDGLDAAAIAFDTLRRVLPDTDIYVSAAPA